MTPLPSTPSNWTELIDAVYQNVAKAHATHKVAGRVKWRGIPISIEQMPGDTRRGIDPDGKAWETRMTCAYGRILGTETPAEGQGGDGEHLDCFIDLDKVRAPTALSEGDVYVIHTLKPGSEDYDEDKVMIGFESRRNALDCFAAHYTDPEKHFGAVSVIPAEELETHCKAGRSNWGKALVPHAAAKVKLNRRRAARLAAEAEDRRDWLKALASRRTEQAADAPLSPIEKAVAAFGEAMEVGKATPVKDESGERLIMIEPGFDMIDQQGDWIPLSTIAHAWAYYEVSGNIDLEHISKRGGESYEARCKAIKDAGFEPEHRFARIQYEIGRPVKDSIHVRLADGTELKGTAALKARAGENIAVTHLCFVARIYKNNEAADWFWKTWTEQQPPVPWRPSVAGSVLAVETLLEDDEPVLSIKGKRKVKVARRFMWSNTAMTMEPVVHRVAEIRSLTNDEERTLRARRVIKSVCMFDDAPETISALEVIKGAMLHAGLAALSDMHGAEQIDADQFASMTAEITKSVGVLAEEVFGTEVSKALDYGAVSTDASQLTQGGAATFASEPEDLTDFRREIIARELHKATIEGYSPISKAVGYEPPSDPEEFLSDVGDCAMQHYGCNSDDGLAIAQRFVQLLLGR